LVGARIGRTTTTTTSTIPAATIINTIAAVITLATGNVIEH
jgi:hypothetical protein